MKVLLWTPILLLAIGLALVPTFLVMWLGQLFYSLFDFDFVTSRNALLLSLVPTQIATGVAFAIIAAVMSRDTRSKSAVIIGSCGTILFALVYFFVWAWLVDKMYPIIGFFLAVGSLLVISNRIYSGKLILKKFKGE